MLYQWHSNTPDISQEQRADSSYNSRVERFKANGDFPTATQRFNPQERVWNHQKWWYIREYDEVSIICMTAKTAINDYFNGETINIMAKLIWFLGCTFKCQEDGYCLKTSDLYSLHWPWFEDAKGRFNDVIHVPRCRCWQVFRVSSGYCHVFGRMTAPLQHVFPDDFNWHLNMVKPQVFLRNLSNIKTCLHVQIVITW